MNQEAFMKKKFFLLFIILTVTGSLYAQALYFDIGIGVGKATTKFDGNDVMDSFVGVDEIGVDFGLKLGYGPLFSMPVYLAAEFSGTGHRIYDDFNYIQYNSYILGPSLIFYPVKFLQIAGSFGYSFVANTSDLNVIFAESTGGYAWNISAAFDLGGGNHGLLLGAKYTMASNTLETDVKEKQSLIAVFIKYAYRQKKGRSSNRSSTDW